MSKIDDFKEFVSNHTEFIDMVHSNKTTWQKLYEMYDLYGDNNDIWSRYTSSSIKDTIDIKGLVSTLKDIDLDSLEENITSIQKAVGLIEEFTKPNKEEKIKPDNKEIDKLYGDNNES